MDITKPQAMPEQPKHETRDVSLRLIMVSLVSLSILIVLSLAIIQGFIAVLARQEASRIVPLPPLAGEQVAPEPRLQASPAEHLRILRAEEDAILNSYGWINEEAGVVHLPLDRAMELTLERGLPTRSGQ